MAMLFLKYLQIVTEVFSLNNFYLKVKQKLLVLNVRKSVPARYCVWAKSIFTSRAFNVKNVTNHLPPVDSFPKTVHTIVPQTIKSFMAPNVPHAMTMLKVRWCRQWERRTIKSVSPAIGAISRSNREPR